MLMELNTPPIPDVNDRTAENTTGSRVGFFFKSREDKAVQGPPTAKLKNLLRLDMQQVTH